jgi:RHS repeat-associated protein
VTWNTAPTAETTLLASLGSVSPNIWYEVDVTSLITGDGTYSLHVSDSVGGADYSSKEGANDPELVLTLGGTPVATNTPTLTPTPGPSPTPTKTSTPTVAPTTTATVPPAPFNNASFVYDGDGKRVKSTFNDTTTTYFVGAHYEVTGSTITKYYYAGSQRIAMRTNGTLNYVLGDHLGSTSLTTNASGQVVSELRYKAWGETRYASGNMPTKYQYTGQYYDSDFGLHFYNARWYDSALGRFAQADTVIPLGQGVQAWDRYAYTNNNPIRFTDPSGHCIRCVVVTTTVITAGSFILSAVGATPDYVGAVTTMALTDTNDAVVSAGLTVQSQYPWAMFMGSGRGMSQIPQDKLDHLLDPDGQSPYSPSVAVEAMDALINQEIDQCNQLCSTGVDKLIVAAIAQNGYELDFSSLPRTPENTINWDRFFEGNAGSGTSDLFAQIRQEVTGMDYSAEFMLKLYIQDLRLLMKFGRDLPEWAEEKDVKYIEDNYLRNKDKDKE